MKPYMQHQNQARCKAIGHCCSRCGTIKYKDLVSCKLSKSVKFGKEMTSVYVHAESSGMPYKHHK